MIISHIVAVDKNYAIGKDNKMLWHIPEDFKNFKKLTEHHHILMGRKTYESIGRLLPNRISLIISRNKNYKVKGAYVFDSIDSAISFATNNDEKELYIIGGSEIYKQTLSQTNRIYLSYVDQIYDADTFYLTKNSNKELTDLKYWGISSQKSFSKQLHTPGWDFKVLERRMD